MMRGIISSAPVTYPTASEGFTPKMLNSHTDTTTPMPMICARPNVAPPAGVV